MADTKISALTAASAATTTHEYAVNEGGVSKKVNGSQLQDLLGVVKLHLGSRATNATTTGGEITGLRATGLTAGTYVFRYYLIVQSTATNTGLKFGINFTGVTTKIIAHLVYPSTGTTASSGVADDISVTTSGQLEESMVVRSLSSTSPNLGPYAGVSTANVDIINIIEGVIVTSTSGNLELWHGSELSNSTSIEVGSSLILTKIT